MEAGTARERRARGPRGRFRAVPAAALALALALAACSPHADMDAELDALVLPGDLALVGEDSAGPPFCFAGDCPSVAREYASRRPVEDVCDDLRAAVETWGVTAARWRVSGSEANPCTASARRGEYWVSVAVLDFERFERLYADRAAGAPPGSVSAIRIRLRAP